MKRFFRSFTKLKFSLYKFLSRFIPYFKIKLMESLILNEIEKILNQHLANNKTPYTITHKQYSYSGREKYVPHRISFVLENKYRQNIYELLIEYYSDDNEIHYKIYHPKRVALFENVSDAENLKSFYIGLQTLNDLVAKTFINASLHN